MELRLYNTLDSDNVINKTLTRIYTMNIKIKDTISITNPILILSKVDKLNYFECNYCFLSGLNRYYFIREIEVLNNNNYRFILECDVLESFKNDILNSYAEYKRKVKQGDYLQVNNINDVRKEIDIYESNVSLNGDKSIIFSSIGG